MKVNQYFNKPRTQYNSKFQHNLLLFLQIYSRRTVNARESDLRKEQMDHFIRQ